AGGSQTVTVTATDAYGNTDTSYTGDKTQIQFSGAANSTSPLTHPTVADKNGTARNFNSNETLTFTNGLATGAMKLYKVETANVAVTDGTIAASSGSDRLTVAVGAAAASRLVVTAAATETAGASQTITVTATDPYGNTDTGFA